MIKKYHENAWERKKERKKQRGIRRENEEVTRGGSVAVV